MVKIDKMTSKKKPKKREREELLSGPLFHRSTNQPQECVDTSIYRPPLVPRHLDTYACTYVCTYLIWAHVRMSICRLCTRRNAYHRCFLLRLDQSSRRIFERFLGCDSSCVESDRRETRRPLCPLHQDLYRGDRQRKRRTSTHTDRHPDTRRSSQQLYTYSSDIETTPDTSRSFSLSTDKRMRRKSGEA